MKPNKNFWNDKVKEAAVLNPVDRIAEVLFGLIMVLTFTGAISASTDAREDVRELLWAALGCNVAWGLVDAIMYLMNVAIERGHAIKVIREIHQADTANQASEILKDEIQPAIAGLMTSEELNAISIRLKSLPEPSKKNLITPTDLWAGVQIFLLVFLCTFPVALPFAFIDELPVAMRASNGVALLLLFIGGFLLAGYAGFRRVLTALVYTLIGVALVALTMALGG
ncbi:MAG: VIT1/CCC1 transporter family protein [Cyclobacteriaceae bacterium]|nr:VIT1/CCC1 transporter family protein [Cyclobacteriaceae bacterium]MBX2956895.1 VIT1/CCC1 transporter family protein [Cyclobacteriaceae bacterium]